MGKNYLRHVGIFVNNLEEMSEFYIKCFGFSVHTSGIEGGDYLEKFLGIEGIELKNYKLIDEHGMILELLQAQSDYGDLHSDKVAKLGCIHVAITVSNLDSMYDKVKDFGCSPLSEPLISPDHKAKVCFCRDPEGNYLELVEELKGEQ